MPKRKRGGGVVSGDALRRRRAEAQRARRAAEAEEEAQRRRQENASRMAERRAAEAEEEAERRRLENASRMAETRAAETEEEAERRRLEDAIHHSQARAAETEEEAERRRLEDAIHHSQARAAETEEERNARLEVLRGRAADRRTEESMQPIPIREERLHGNRARRTRSDLRNAARCGLNAQVDPHSCGAMEGVCNVCGAFFFPAEKNSRGRYNNCCHEGKINEGERNYPVVMRELITGQHELSSDFFRDIRSYNSLMGFASMGANVQLPQGSGPFCFRIHGAIYHKTSPIHPREPGREQFAQLYILDSNQALMQRMNILQDVNLNPSLLSLLDDIIRNINPFASAYKMMREFEEDVLRQDGAQSSANIRMFIKGEDVPRGEHRGRYNAARENEVAAVFKSEDGVPPSNRDIVIHPRGGGLINISTLNPNLEPMTYVLFFPHGDRGFKVGQSYSELQFYSHRVSVRRNIFNPILLGRKLFQQYIVDCYVKVEGNRLAFLRANQKKLRVESYRGLADHIYRRAQESGVRPGIPVILPSSFIGSPRSMQQNYQDAMAIVRDFGKPDLFVTFTCNPKWPEITDNLFPGQKAHDRPDVVSRVFDLKKTALLEDLTKKHILGVTVAHVHVIEFQKRGLPHMHLLLILDQEDKIRDAETIDALVCAELPDEAVDPVLHSVVESTMIHGPCGDLNPRSPCMVDGVCSKDYPKNFQEETKENVAGYPLYRRRDDGRSVSVRGNDVDNRWVVPYNPYLTKKYNAHINVEVCSSIKTVKYIFKYVYKGHDAAKLVLEEAGDSTLMWDEIKMFLNARYVSAPEAVWRLQEKSMHQKSHSIIRLPVHLENLQPVYFQESEENEALQRAGDRDTMLTGWFRLNERLPEANQYLYVEIPKHFTWTTDNAWKTRVRLGSNIISRMYSVSPRDIERFHLRMLLCHVKGAKNFVELRTFEGVQYPTFKEACKARHLLQDDEEWRNCLAEASTFQMPAQLRQLFSFICIFCSPAEPSELWSDFEDHMTEDYRRSYPREQSVSLALRSVQQLLRAHNFSLAALGLPEPSFADAVVADVPVYDVEFERQRADELSARLNPEQRAAYDCILEAVRGENADCPKSFMISAFAGAGKTFLFKTILHAVRGMGHIAVPVAWTGIAAVLMTGGRTVHSTFKLPVPVLENSSCHVREDSDEGRYLKAAKIVIWDEVTMAPHYALDAVDRLLRDLTREDVPFGGKVLVLGGDWRQTLPVTVRGSRATAVESCIRNSHLWPHFRQFSLVRNMRLSSDEQEFSEWLLRLGDGRLENDSGVEGDIVEIPPPCIVRDSILDEIFGDLDLQEDLVDKAILCPKNEDALKMNEEILTRLPGEMRAYYSADSIECEDEEEQDTYQLDFVHSLTPSGMPPHCLNLKENCIVMLLRNMNPKIGLCNGTRLIVRRLMRNVLDCEVITGQNAGSRVFIPRITLSPSDANLPFALKRTQFPVRVAYCMTINKSQGQTLRKVGIYLPQPVFSHGMLYVAFSRTTSMHCVRVLVKDTGKQGRLIRNSGRVFTQNVVYREVLD